MAVSSDILRGYTETVILHILTMGDSYGYLITNSITELSGGMIEVKDATVYMAFRRMETEELITTYWGDGTQGARRRYYAITEKGREFYEMKKAEWLEVRNILNLLILGGAND